MRSIVKGTAVAVIGAAFATSAEAAEILVSSDIATSTTWTANNTYNLQGQIYVLPGATLTIEAGVVVASDPGGSLAVSNGAKLCALGSQTDPIVFTSKADVATWAPMAGHPTGRNPRTGTWREAANEWGNITIMGDAFISENATAGNVPTCDPDNVAAMEGLVADFPGDTKVLYGGGDDDDDSGVLSYVSLRYGGKVVGLGNELNGLSLGGIGRETDIHHVDIMNNVDDGVEIWGGTACLSYFNIWNVGDDSFDVDQGFRGKVQFVLIVQGYSLDASQGSGVGDNCFEVDGAEDSDWQPVTTTVVYNATVIGQPVDGDHGTAWRDNARVQYRNCIFMDLGEDLVKFDNVDGDGANGYGHNGTLSWPATWTTNWNAAPPHANDCPPGTYTAQINGKLAEIRDSVFFRNLKGGGVGASTDPAYAEANARGVFAAGNNNVFIPGFADVDAPVKSVVRGAPVVRGGKTMLPVVSLDPRPAGPALVRLDDALKPNLLLDGWYENADYRGAFAPEDTWLDQWTASYAFGFTTTTGSWTNPGCDLEGQAGQAYLVGSGHAADGVPVLISLHNANPNAIAALFLSVAVGGVAGLPFKGGVLKWDALLPPTVVNVLPQGNLPVAFAWPSGIPAGIELWAQWGIQDPGALFGVALSNAVYATSR